MDECVVGVRKLYLQIALILDEIGRFLLFFISGSTVRKVFDHVERRKNQISFGIS